MSAFQSSEQKPAPQVPFVKPNNNDFDAKKAQTQDAIKALAFLFPLVSVPRQNGS